MSYKGGFMVKIFTSICNVISSIPKIFAIVDNYFKQSKSNSVADKKTDRNNDILDSLDELNKKSNKGK
jgi:hypothetical protein